MTASDAFTAGVPTIVLRDPVYTRWEEALDGSLRVRIQAAIDKIETSGIVTNAKDLGGGLYEKKWNSGLRLYFAIVDDHGLKTFLLLGSGKGEEQNKAIRKSRRILMRYNVLRARGVK